MFGVSSAAMNKTRGVLSVWCPCPRAHRGADQFIASLRKAGAPMCVPGDKLGDFPKLNHLKSAPRKQADNRTRSGGADFVVGAGWAEGESRERRGSTAPT